MKKLTNVFLILLIATMLVSCAGTTPASAVETPKPGVSIGGIRVEEYSPKGVSPDLTLYCGDYQTLEMEPGTHITDCEVPLLPRLHIDFGWGASDVATLEANWAAMTWELYIDGHQVDLDQFEPMNEVWANAVDDKDVQARGWTLDLFNLSPGKHTLRLLWKSEVPIDDGFDVYAPGTYENIVNFTVGEK